MQGLQLFGSTTSPYVRRLRMFMQDIDYEFVLVEIFNSRVRSEIKSENPTLKIPMIKDGEQIVLDSGNIYRYLSQKHNIEKLTWDQNNLLASIDSVNESLVQMLTLSRSEIDTSADKLYFRIQRERMDVVFAHLEEHATLDAFKHWNYLSISLFCLLDWVFFRNLHDISNFKELMNLHNNWSKLAISHETDPRI